MGQNTIALMPGPAYVSGHEDYRVSLEAEIRRVDGLVAPVGLCWLQKGVNTVGSSTDCTLRLTKPAPRLVGSFDLDGRLLTFRADLSLAPELDGVVRAPGDSINVRPEISPRRIRFGDISRLPIQI